MISSGDRVAVEPHVVCWKCELCGVGRYNFCKNLLLLAADPYDGALAQYHDKMFFFYDFIRRQSCSGASRCLLEM